MCVCVCVGQRFVATAAEECRPSGVDQLIRQLNDLGILSRASGTHGREREANPQQLSSSSLASSLTRFVCRVSSGV